MPSMNLSVSTPAAAAIYHLVIERFRGIKALSWHPGRGVNLILGGGDIGKTTILEAVGLLFSPTNSTTLSDTDYYARDEKEGFVIEAVVTLPQASGINHQIKPSWPWAWNGSEALVPSINGDDQTKIEPVYRLRVRGTEDLELVYEIVQPDGTTDNLSVALRRAIGLVRLSGDDRNDRDLRLVQGSALDRLLSDKGLRSRLASELAKQNVQEELTGDAKDILKALDMAFAAKSLPHDLALAIIGGQGLSLAALIGLTAERQGIQLPLACWGTGTRRIAALTIAELNQGESPIMLVDEAERGLEPYRQRSLMDKLQEGKSQVFVTTHSSIVISSASRASLWYIDHAGKIGPLEATKIAYHRQYDPETFLAILTVVAEGATEVGFVTFLLERALGSSLLQHGIHVTDGGGHEKTIEFLETLAKGGLQFGVFADDEKGKHPERWERIEQNIGNLLFRWTSGCLEENIIRALPDDKLEALSIDPTDEKTGMRWRTLADRISSQDKDFETIKAKAGTAFKDLIVAAALGTVPEDKMLEKKQYRAHAHTWFKSVQGGRELAAKVISLGVWSTLEPRLMPFINAVRKAVNLVEIQELET
jgi:putative ATP-dependent endonuclease of the OLD family